MRNLKKILALALALVMSMSLMATANAFTDDDSITDTYETAVTVLSGLKVFQGYDDGSFLPQGAITRAEVAAIIYRIVTGDVADTQVGIYADYNKFDDVASTSWYAGYVNFCANAEYIKGYDARTFGPNDPVTGYQALAMILRALGYDKNGEFTGTNWTIQTAAVGESRGITKNITAGTLGVPATREVVAEILFQAILVNTVTYMPAFGYREDETSLGWETFGLEYVTGVVTANEYADLYDTEPLDEGETRLDVDGTDYDIAYSTTLEEMGMAYNVYLADGGQVLAIADAGNTVFETGEGTEIDEDNTGMDVDTAQKFLNFDEDTVYTSDWRIEYVLKFEASATQSAAQVRADFEEDMGLTLSSVMTKAANAEEYSKVIRPDRDITAADMKLIREIFEIADKEDDANADEYVTGEVYVGTSSTDDVSDDHSFRQFMDEYINDEENDANFDESDNGEWLKVIDNDGDGVADYIFLTEFVMSYIERISRDDEYTLADLAADDAADFDDVVIDGADIATEDELAVGDVVIYTLIDGVYYMDIADVVTETVDARGIDSRNETMTCDGTEYEQSHISYTDETYYNDVTDAHTEYTYDLYLDHFGYVRLFIESDYNTFMLLTDGYYHDDRRVETFGAMFWNVEAEEEQQIDVVANDGAREFIYDYTVVGDVETWGRLYGADFTYDLHEDGYITNIAGYSETSDGYDLKNVEDSAARVGYEVHALDTDADQDLDEHLKERLLDGHFHGYENGVLGYHDSRIQTNTNTQYYLVIKGEDRYGNSVVDDVITWTGYANAPAEAKLENAVGYAVTHETRTTDATTGDTYYVADVVVFETDAYADRNTYFVFETNNFWRNEYVLGIGYNADGEIVDDIVYAEGDDTVDFNNYGDLEFYVIYDNGDVDFIGDVAGDYAAHNIYAGTVDTGWDLEPDDYIQVNEDATGSRLYIGLDAPIYKVTHDDDELEYNVATIGRDDVSRGDKMILFTDDDKNVEYAIDVTASVYDTDRDGNGLKDDIIDGLYGYPAARIVAGYGLWNRIVDDATPIDYEEQLEAVIDIANDALAMPETTAEQRAAKDAALENALALLNALWDDDDAMDAFDADQIIALSTKINQVIAAMNALDDIVDAETATQEMIDAWNAYNAAADKEDFVDRLLDAAIDYKPYNDTTSGTADANAAYDKAVDVAADELDDCFGGSAGIFMSTKDLDTFALMEDMEGMMADLDQRLLDLVTGAQAHYDALVADYELRSDMFELAHDLVEAYSNYLSMQGGVGAAVDQAEADLLAAYNAVAAGTAPAHNTIQTWFDDHGSYDFGYDNITSYDDTYNAARNVANGQPQKAVADLVLDKKKNGWRANFSVDSDGNGLLIVMGINGYNYTDWDEDNIGDWLGRGDDAVGTLTWEQTKTGNGYNVFTATFDGPNGGQDATVDVTVRNATAAEKAAHDLSLAKAEVEAQGLIRASNTARDAVETEVTNYLNNKISALTTLWGAAPTAVAVYAGGDSWTLPGTSGSSVDMPFQVTITAADNSTVTVDIQVRVSIT